MHLKDLYLEDEKMKAENLKVRIISKSAIRSWDNGFSRGLYFCLNVMDASDEIRLTVFNKMCFGNIATEINEKFNDSYDKFDVDGVCSISWCDFKLADSDFASLNNKYELILNLHNAVRSGDMPEIEQCMDDPSIPIIKCNLVPIAEVYKMDPSTIVDVIGICESVGEVRFVTSSTTDIEYQIRELTLRDGSGTKINLNLWNTEAINFGNFDGNDKPLMLVKSVLVSEYCDDKSLNMTISSVRRINNSILNDKNLRDWFENGVDNFKLVLHRSECDFEYLTCEKCELIKLEIKDKESSEAESSEDDSE